MSYAVMMLPILGLGDPVIHGQDDRYNDAVRRVLKMAKNRELEPVRDVGWCGATKEVGAYQAWRLENADGYKQLVCIVGVT